VKKKDRINARYGFACLKFCETIIFLDKLFSGTDKLLSVIISKVIFSVIMPFPMLLFPSVWGVRAFLY
jgi:hypothetical protein